MTTTRRGGGTISKGKRIRVVATGDASVTVSETPTEATLTIDASVPGGSGITALTGDVTASGSGSVAATIAADAVTYAKMQNVSAASRLLGRGSAGGAGNVEEVTLGAGLSLTGTVLAATGGSAATTVEVDLGATAKWQGRFTITDAAITATSKVLCWQAPGPYTGKGTRADEATMQPVSVISVEPATGSAVVQWQTPPGFTQQVILPDGRRFATSAVGNEQMMFPTLIPRRVGKVRGNVKFSYLVLS